VAWRRQGAAVKSDQGRRRAACDGALAASAARLSPCGTKLVLDRIDFFFLNSGSGGGLTSASETGNAGTTV
jgi:hypothetical protein